MDDQQARDLKAWVAENRFTMSTYGGVEHVLDPDDLLTYLAALPVAPGRLCGDVEADYVVDTLAPEQPTQANEEWRSKWDIHPDSVSKLTGATYSEVVSDVRRRQSLNDDQAQHAIDKALFNPPALVSSPSELSAAPKKTVTPVREAIPRETIVRVVRAAQAQLVTDGHPDLALGLDCVIPQFGVSS